MDEIKELRISVLRCQNLVLLVLANHWSDKNSTPLVIMLGLCFVCNLIEIAMIRHDV